MKKQFPELTNEKQNGRFYTPPFIVNCILDLSDYVSGNIRKKHVIDNSCGDGAFLTEIVRRYCEECISSDVDILDIKSEIEEYIHGVEIDELETQRCIKNVTQIAESFGIYNVNWDIICYNSLRINRFNGMMDFVLGNPPYIRVHNLGNSLNEIKAFLFAQNGMTDLFIVFYEIGLKMLNKTGVLGYITPSSFYSSLAGNYMREQFVAMHYMDKVVDLKHFQAFEATTYTTIVVLRNNKESSGVGYYSFDEGKKAPVFVSVLEPEDFYISGSFYFGSKDQLAFLKKILYNVGHSDIRVKNGYATLCDDVFIDDFDFNSSFFRPVVKASRGITKKIFYPYDQNASLISESDLKTDKKLYDYLLSNKQKLIRRSNERDGEKYWYAFGRSQALLDTYKEKVAINALLRNKSDIKLTPAPAGTGVYSGLYIVSEKTPIYEIEVAIKTDEFITYVSLLSKYKSGGYYTFSSKDLQAFLDYKFAYDGGLLNYDKQ